MSQCMRARAIAGAGVVSLAAVFAVSVQAEESKGGIEEVIVTAQRTAESIQDVPIAVTALSGEMLEEKQVITVSDLQMNAPNVSFSDTNFGSNSFSIRGIGRLVTSSTGDAGVSIHTNDIPISSNINAVEFYDMERVEVLRGPQGTLYGRNATGGAINFVTKKPDYDAIGGFVDVEAADYSHVRAKGALNVPVTDNFALRFAGMKLDRDGYIKNLAAGQVGLDGRTLDGIDKDIDGRDILDFRITAAWQINDNADAWVMYNRFDEDDDRARITNQICVQNPIPVQGCMPDEYGFESPNVSTGLAYVLASLYSLVPLGVTESGPSNWPRPKLGLRTMHTDLEPVFDNQQNTYLGGFNYEFDNFSLGIVGGYYDYKYLTQQDYSMDVGAELPFNFYRADGLYPISAPAGDHVADLRPGPCNLLDGTSGIFGGCTLIDDLSRGYVYDQADSKGDGWSVEAKVRSSFDGPFNFLLGATAFNAESHGDYYVFANLYDALPLYPSFYDNISDPAESKGWAVFGEGYFDFTDTLKLTVGLRYNEDKKSVDDTAVLVGATDVHFAPCFVGDFANCSQTGLGGTADPLISRVDKFVLGADLAGTPIDPAELALIQLYGQESKLAAALLTPPLSPERLAISAAIPAAPPTGETRTLTGSPDSFKWTEFTGRIGLDWQFADNAMAYAFYSRGYKPGGLNPAIPAEYQDQASFSFDKEQIDAFEVGFKSSLLEGQMVLNGSFFYYDYGGLQVNRIKLNTSLNENIDAEIKGAELEMMWRPDALPGLQIDVAYSYLDTQVTNTKSVDPLDRTGGNPDYVTLNGFGIHYAVPKAELTPAVVGTMVAIGGAVVPGSPFYPTATPGVLYPDGTPIFMSQSVLNAVGSALLGDAWVPATDGYPVDLDGNALPNSPENTIHLGLAYTFEVAAIAGSLTARWDYYWQDDSYAREFNTIGDKIDSWDQHNASLSYDSSNGRWTVKAWIRNIADDDNVTGKYVTSDTSGYFRNYFLTEPRLYGASVRFNFGT